MFNSITRYGLIGSFTNRRRVDGAARPTADCQRESLLLIQLLFAMCPTGELESAAQAILHPCTNLDVIGLKINMLSQDSNQTFILRQEY